MWMQWLGPSCRTRGIRSTPGPPWPVPWLEEASLPALPSEGVSARESEQDAQVAVAAVEGLHSSQEEPLVRISQVAPALRTLLGPSLPCSLLGEAQEAELASELLLRSRKSTDPCRRNRTSLNRIGAENRRSGTAFPRRISAIIRAPYTRRVTTSLYDMPGYIVNRYDFTK